MSFNRCTNCNTSMPFNETYSCESCGASVCPICLDGTNAQCQHCGSKVSRG